MRTSIVWVAVLGSALMGLGLGFLLWHEPARPAVLDPSGAATAARASPSSDPHRADERRASGEQTSRQSGVAERAAAGERPSSRELPPHEAEGANPLAGLVTTEEALEVERLRAEVAALNEERTELMGDPIDSPTSTESRFSGPALNDAVSSALARENVPGDVESTDCSEHPCIVFGRLEGDEEDMEEIERSAALSAYRDDVLTLLFWATSIKQRTPGPRAPETGLFALAFYSLEERIERGDALDRRIRARVMEYWNTDRPGLPE